MKATVTTTATVLNFDNYGSYWGADTIAETESLIAGAVADGQTVNEWNVTDRDGRPPRITRICDPTFRDTISVIPALERPDCGARVTSQSWSPDEHHAKCPRHDPHF
ncbi:hypothetical protein [Streptomyces niveus]|uniref:hypothetical protein n=1 Tax=Streptomyces niveus TaxID=193462 RepID=UPI00342BB134